MRNIERRLEQLEEQAALANRPEPAPVDAGELAAGLAAAWRSLDDGTFDGSDYHARSMRCLREALQGAGT